MVFRPNKRFRQQVRGGLKRLGHAIASGIRVTRQKRLQRIKDGEMRGSVPRGHGRIRARGRAFRAARRRR